ncbi:hypothetical protein HKX48_002025 [Thoreauomyces humboldtii]|nr:hypothetical protein HKX48_002025 [Thoreauomyces humboldtii]
MHLLIWDVMEGEEKLVATQALERISMELVEVENHERWIAEEKAIVDDDGQIVLL